MIEIDVTELAKTPLALLAESDRFVRLDRLEAYFRCYQDDTKSYSWDGHFNGYGEKASIEPGWFVPYKLRRPATRYDLGRVIVERLTSFMFGSERFPRITVPGDDDAQDYVSALVEASHYEAKVAQARLLGGAQGAVAMSIGFVNSKPRVEVHNAKHCLVTKWKDVDDREVASALKVFRFETQRVRDGKLKTEEYFSVRYWDETIEIVWEPIPIAIARQPGWWNQPHKTVGHDAGFCPFYWIENLPGPEGTTDGEPDYPERLIETFDEVNQLLSAATKGVKANVDPTLVVKMDPTMNDGTLKRGSDNVIWSTGGADYLELQGQSAQSAIAMLERLRTFALDVSSVVIPDPEKLSGAAQSAAALRLMFAPMTAKCDLLRTQYGEQAIRRPLLGLLRMARGILAREPIRISDELTGDVTEYKPTIDLPPRITEENGEQTITERTPGESENITLTFPTYFPPTADDRTKAIDAAQKASGGKPLVTQKTALQSVADLFGVTDVEAELEGLHADAELEVQRMGDMLAVKAGGVAGAMPGGKGPPDAEPEDED